MVRIESDNRLSESEIRERFAPAERYRFTRATYEVDSRITVISGARTLFVLDGSCRIEADGQTVDAGPGDVLRQEQDGTTVVTVTQGPLTLFSVYELAPT